MRKLIFLLLLILAGYVGYMYFFGKGEDKTQARTIVDESGDVVRSIGDFLKHQKEKYDDGEFDKLIQSIDNGIQKIKGQSSTTDSRYKDQLKDMLNELEKLDPSKLSPENQEKLEKTKRELKELLQ